MESLAAGRGARGTQVPHRPGAPCRTLGSELEGSQIGEKQMSGPDFEVLGIDVRVVQTCLLRATETEEGDEAESMPLALLDFDSSPEAAALMFELISRAEESPAPEVFYVPWQPLPSLGHVAAPAREHAPRVVFTVPAGEPQDGGQPVHAISFTIAVDEHGAFMRHATQSSMMGIAAAPIADWPDDAEMPAVTVVACHHDPGHLGWVELEAWRGALATDRPASYQPILPLEA